MAAKLQSSASNIKSFVIKFSSIKSIPYLFHIIFATIPLPLTLLLHLPATSSPIKQKVPGAIAWHSIVCSPLILLIHYFT